MAEILGLGTTDFPFGRIVNDGFSSLLRMSLKSDKIRPELKDPKNWPKGMQEEWGDDESRTAAGEAREYLIGQWRKLKAALDDFQPDFILIWSKDHGETLKRYAIPQYWIQAHEEFHIRPYANFREFPNWFGEDPDKVVTVKGHAQGGKYLVKGLQQAGFDPTYSLEPMEPWGMFGLAHTFVGVITHLDWDRREFKTPVVPVSIDPFGPRLRLPEGMSPMKPEDPLPISPKRAFELGRHTARILRESPWRVALVAGVGWGHTQNTSWERSWIHPDQEADIRRHEEWKNNKFDTWGDTFTYEDFEEHGQWEHLCWIALAGAMTELGAKVAHSDLRLQWTPPSEWVNTIFTVA